MSVSIRASSPAPTAPPASSPTPKPSAIRASHNPCRRSHAAAPSKSAEGKARPHSLLGYLPSLSSRHGTSSLRETAPPAAPPAPWARHASAASSSNASGPSQGASGAVAPSIRLDLYATGEFKDTEQKRFLGVGPKIFTRAERQLKDKLRTQANFNFDEVMRLRDSVAELKAQLHQVRTDRDVIRDACTGLEQALVGHKSTIRSHEHLVHATLAQVGQLEEKLLANEQRLAQIALIATPTMALQPMPASAQMWPGPSSHRSFGRQSFGIFDDAPEPGFSRTTPPS